MSNVKFLKKLPGKLLVNTGEGYFVNGKLLFNNAPTSLPYLETSAATGLNVNEAVELLLDKIMLRMETAVDRSFGWNRKDNISLAVSRKGFTFLKASS